jgi:hypothetical protein
VRAISEWTKIYAERTSNIALSYNAVMYERHSEWIYNELQKPAKI